MYNTTSLSCVHFFEINFQILIEWLYANLNSFIEFYSKYFILYNSYSTVYSTLSTT